MSKPLCITFAAAPGSGKSQIAYYLSWHLSIGILNNDAIRGEVQAEHEQPLGHDPEEYFKRRDARIKEILSHRKSFIYDASVDRRWDAFAPQANGAGFDILLISLDWSRDLWQRMIVHKGYEPESQQCDDWFRQHLEFSQVHKADISIALTDEHFVDRMQYTLERILLIKNSREG